MNIRKCHTIIFLFPLLLTGCVDDPSEREKPLYPTEGAINARFSVDDNVTVVFSKGNLQYQATSQTWRFAAHQYDIIGHGNAMIDTNYAGWIDLFGWGTSGHNGHPPYSTSRNDKEYIHGEVDIAGSEYDWGQHNPISNAGNQAGIWRTLTLEEWQYLLKFRDQATGKRGLANIYNIDGNNTTIPGLVLLPDKWTLPNSCTFHCGSTDGFETNHYTVAQWNAMEKAGAVFLPAGGYRDSVTVSLVGSYGCYWTSSCYTDATAYELYMQASGCTLSTAARSNGHNVRLVQNR